MVIGLKLFDNLLLDNATAKPPPFAASSRRALSESEGNKQQKPHDVTNGYDPSLAAITTWHVASLSLSQAFRDRSGRPFTGPPLCFPTASVKLCRLQ
jgi:hypothetical protein